ncbi:hypothetical protein [Methylobacterium sp. J-076]|uniref:hypothetical protein n=1 Tax=Methylobacterium sp. J-076 TaxID=2836655 RepID=UPI001FBC07AB|nr:hypothetical protein [Methylobacterium sp. J-076]MCJ2015095.1 hypothetical protein [Methylobacterium sp. J-076]
MPRNEPTIVHPRIRPFETRSAHPEPLGRNLRRAEVVRGVCVRGQIGRDIAMSGSGAPGDAALAATSAGSASRPAAIRIALPASPGALVEVRMGDGRTRGPFPVSWTGGVARLAIAAPATPAREARA